MDASTATQIADVSPPIEAEDVRRAAEEVLSRSYYKLNEGMTVQSEPFFARILNAIADFLRPVFSFFAGLWDMSPVLAVLVMLALIVIAVLLILHIVYTFKQALGRPREFEDGAPAAPKWDDPKIWEDRARAAALEGDYIGAVRFFLRAALARLERSGGRRLKRGATNRECLRVFGTGALDQPLALLVDTIDRKWYGTGVCGEGDLSACGRAYETIRKHLRGS